MPGYPSFPKHPEQLGRIVVLQSSGATSVAASQASMVAGVIAIPFAIDIESGYFTARQISVASTASSTLYIYEGTTKIASLTVTSAMAGCTNGNSVQTTAGSVTIPSGANQFAAGALIKMKIKTSAKFAVKNPQLTLIGMKVDHSSGYRS